jgi:MFS family permease
VTVATSSQASTVPTSSGDARVSLSSWLGLAALMIVLMYSMVDRQIFTLLAEAIRKDMALSDTQLGLLQGVGLALVGVATTYPIAWLADRFDRRLVAVGCVVSWSAAVMLCGLAPNFPWLLIGASVVGVGEAGVTPIGYAMIADLFPESKRQLANSVLAIGSRLSASAAAAIAGMTILGANILRPVLPHTLANLSQWRLGFLVTALFLPIAVLLLLTLPRRVSGLAKKTGDGSLKLSRQKAPAAPVLSFLRRNARAQFGFFIGIAVATFGFACVGIWVPVIAARDYHQTPAAAGTWMASMSLISGILGFVLGNLVLGWLRPRFGVRLPMMALAAVTFLGAPCSILIGFATNANQLYEFWGAQAVLLMTYTMVGPTVLQNMSPLHLRSRLFALLGLFGMVAGAVSPVVVGLVSDLLHGLPHALLIAAMASSTIALVVSSVILWSTVDSYAVLAVEADPTP